MLVNPASIDAASLAQRPSGGAARVVIDTDAGNEIDDQFAVAYALLSPERIELEALYAAPFHNAHSTGPGDGMRQSYQELHRLLTCFDPRPELPVLEGARTWLPAPGRPVTSPASEDLAGRALDGAAPLHVVALGAPTNVAAAILAAPEVVDRIVVVWLGGNPSSWHPAVEFNVQQDPHAARVLLDSGVRLVHVPCRTVTEQLRTTQPEIERYVRGRGQVGDYLADLYDAAFPDHFGRSRSLWDLGPVAWLVDPDWAPTMAVHSPLLTDQGTWSHDPFRHLILEVRSVERDAVFTDLFRKLDQASTAAQPATGAR